MPTWAANRLCRPIWQLWRDLYQVVDLRPGPDPRRPEGAPVDGRAGPDLHVVADLDVPDLGHLDVPALDRAEPEPVRPDHRVGVDDHPVAEHAAVVDDRVRAEGDVVAEAAVVADADPGVEPAAGPDYRPLADGRRAGRRSASGPRRGRRVDDRRRVDAGPVAAGRACIFWTMVTKAMSGSLTRTSVLPLSGTAWSTTAAPASEAWNWGRYFSSRTTVISSSRGRSLSGWPPGGSAGRVADHLAADPLRDVAHGESHVRSPTAARTRPARGASGPVCSGRPDARRLLPAS